MGSRKHSRIGLGDINIAPQSVFVADHGEGRFTIHCGSFKLDTSEEAFTDLVEAVWSRYFRAIEHKRYLDGLLPDRATLNRKRPGVVA